MSDIDFDELDKAVNSLVGDDDAPSSADKKPDLPSDPPKSDDSANNNAVGGSSPSNLPSRRAGRFMDMKHDSSDMKKDSAPSLTTSSKATLTPINPDTKPDSPKEDTGSDEKDVDASGKNDSEEASPDSTNRFTSQQEKKMQLDSPMDKKDNDTKLELDDDNPKKDDKEEDSDTKPSPFLDDAKVEKRPLGGFSSESPVEPIKSDDQGDAGAESGEETQPAQTPSEPIELPPELDKDLVAIESGLAPEVPANEPDTVADNQLQGDDKDSDSKEKKEESVDKKDADKKDEPSKKDHKEEVSQLLASAAGGSIPDQYKRENRSHELHAAHPLFDSEHFKNSPQSAPKKPKSKLKSFFQVVLVVVGLLLLGGSLGAAVFVLVSQQ